MASGEEMSLRWLVEILPITLIARSITPEKHDAKENSNVFTAL